MKDQVEVRIPSVKQWRAMIARERRKQEVVERERQEGWQLKFRKNLVEAMHRVSTGKVSVFIDQEVKRYVLEVLIPELRCRGFAVGVVERGGGGQWMEMWLHDDVGP
jgi:hypothetical protein